MKMTKPFDEPILEDDYPVYWNYIYVADGVPIMSDIQGTVRELKHDLNATEIRRCDMAGRNMF